MSDRPPSTLPSVDDRDWARAHFEAELATLRVVFGARSIERLGELLRSIGVRRPLVVSDVGVRAAGHLDRALRVLRQAGAEPVVFTGVDENPTQHHVEAGLALARQSDIDGIVAVGGGSPMDCAKAINLVLGGGGRIEDYRAGQRDCGALLPSLGVPTTAGTGSEAQSYALISDEATHVKMACGHRQARFRAVILDPCLAATAPAAVAAATAMDAVSHAVESYVTTRRNPVAAMLAREAWRCLEPSMLPALGGRDDVGAWGRLLWGAHLAGAAIEQSMLGAAHACANPLTARHGIVHGVAVGLMLPAVVRFNATVAAAQYAELMDVAAGDGAERLASRLMELRAGAGLPQRLRDCSVPADEVDLLAQDAEAQWTVGFNPRPAPREALREIYVAAY